MLLALFARPAQAGSSADGVALGPDRGWVVSLSMSPNFAVDGRAWAAPYGGRVFATDDRGATWSPSRLGITDPVVTGITASPDFARDRMVFATADDGVFRSVDAGTTWANTSTGLGGHACRVVALDPSFGTSGVAYVATDGGVFRSPFEGTQWFPTAVTEPVISLATGPGGLVLAGLSNGGIERSLDGGQTWTSVAGFPVGRTTLSLAIAGNTAAVAGTDQGIWLSQDGGSSWTESNVKQDRIDAVSLSPSFAIDGRGLAGSAGGMGAYQTSDGGVVWRSAPPSSPSYVSSIAVTRSATGALTAMAGSVGDGIFRSSDAGTIWSTASVGLAAASVTQLAGSSGEVLEGGLGGASIRSASQNTWSDLPDGSKFVNAVAMFQRHFFIGTEDQGLRISYDGGTTFHAAPLSDGRVSAIGLSPNYASDSTLIVAEGNVYKSVDSGLTWTRATGMGGNDVRRFRFSPAFATDKTAFAATVNHGVFRTIDGGQTWQQLSGGLPGGQISDVLPSQNYASDRTVYAATSGQGVYESSNAGDSWAPLPAQPEQRVVSALTWTSGGLLAAGTEKGAFLLSNGSWARIAGQWDSYVTDLKNGAPNGVEVLFAGTLGDGVWQLPLSQSGTASLNASATPTHTVPAIPTCPCPTVAPSPTVRPPPHPPKLIRAWVMPKALHAGGIALLRMQGPSWARVTATMSSPGWRRSAGLQLNARGMGAFGFLAPRQDFRVLVVARTGKRTGRTEFIARLVH